MNFEEYLHTVAQRCKPLPHREHLAHMAMGVTGEFGEVCEMIKKHTIYGKELDRDKLVLEVGDICWYVGGFAVQLEVSPHIMEVAFEYGSRTELLDCPDTEYIVALASIATKTASELTEIRPDYPATGIEGVMVLCEMLGMLCSRFDLVIGQVLHENNVKLAKRYDQAFNAEQAINRKDVAPSIMGMVETPTSAFITATPVAAKWDGHGTARESNTGPGPSPETEAFWDRSMKIIEAHVANDKDSPRME
jgi:NTP pyrophosphatase (non-canonical NTP hydrolase)